MGAGIVEGIFSLVVFWVIAVVLTYLVMRATSPKNVAGALFFVIVGLPLILLGFMLYKNESNQRNYNARVVSDEAKKFQEYLNICQRSEAKVLEKISQDHPRGVKILDKKQFKGGATSLGLCLFGGEVNSSTCVGSKIDFFEEQVAPHSWLTYSKGSDVSAFSSERFVPFKENYVSTSSAKYGLILGLAEDPLEFTTNAGYKIGKSTIKLVHVSSGRLLAQRQVYFMNSSSGNFGCPEENREISEMLRSVFQ